MAIAVIWISLSAGLLEYDVALKLGQGAWLDIRYSLMLRELSMLVVSILGIVHSEII